MAVTLVHVRCRRRPSKAAARGTIRSGGNVRFDQRLSEFKGEKDVGLRNEMYCEMQQILRNDAGQVMPSVVIVLKEASDKVETLNTNRMA